MSSNMPAVLPDTNFLIDYPKIHKEAWQLRPLHLLISKVVISELEGLSCNEYPLLANNVLRALNVRLRNNSRSKKANESQSKNIYLMLDSRGGSLWLEWLFGYHWTLLC